MDTIELGDVVQHPTGWYGPVVHIGWRGVEHTPTATVAWQHIVKGRDLVRPPGTFGRVPLADLTLIERPELGIHD